MGSRLPVPARPGYTFVGWWVDVDKNGIKNDSEGEGNAIVGSDGVVSNDLQSFGITQDLSLHSYWTENTYNIAFDANGGSGSMSAINGVKYTDTVNLTDNAFSKTGYTFIGWNTDKNGNGASYADKDVVSKLSETDGATVTLYAQWKINTYSVTFNFANGTSDVKSIAYGSSVTVPSNSTKLPDAKYHYSYSWSPSVATTVTDNATYNEVLEQTEHNWGNWQTTSYPSCTVEGSKQRSCSDCGYVEVSSVEKVSHTLVRVSAKAPSCTTDGNIAYWTCVGCGNIYSDESATTEITEEQTVIAAKGHDYGNWTYVADGQHKRVCANDNNHVETEDCADVDSDTDCNCDKCGNLVKHNEAKREENRVEPTCGKDGKYDSVTYCSVCKEVISRTTITLPATGNHNYATEVEGSRIPATCSDTGKVTMKCGCGAETEVTLEIVESAHDWNEWVHTTVPTCSAVGEDTRTCKHNPEHKETKEVSINSKNHVNTKEHSQTDAT